MLKMCHHPILLWVLLGRLFPIVFGVVGILRRRARLLLLRLTLRLTLRRSVFEAHCLSDPSHPGSHQAR
jgi:hypothetical protein